MNFKSLLNTENVICLLSPLQGSGPENVPLNDLGHDDCWDQEEEELDDKGRSKFIGHSQGSVVIEQLLRNHKPPPNTASSGAGVVPASSREIMLIIMCVCCILQLFYRLVFYFIKIFV